MASDGCLVPSIQHHRSEEYRIRNALRLIRRYSLIKNKNNNSLVNSPDGGSCACDCQCLCSSLKYLSRMNSLQMPAELVILPANGRLGFQVRAGSEVKLTNPELTAEQLFRLNRLALRHGVSGGVENLVRRRSGRRPADRQVGEHLLEKHFRRTSGGRKLVGLVAKAACTRRVRNSSRSAGQHDALVNEVSIDLDACRWFEATRAIDGCRLRDGLRNLAGSTAEAGHALCVSARPDVTRWSKPVAAWWKTAEGEESAESAAGKCGKCGRKVRKVQPESAAEGESTCQTCRHCPIGSSAATGMRVSERARCAADAGRREGGCPAEDARKIAD